MRRKVTIQSIADYTGLSKFAVSRGLSGKSGVSPHTRELILRAAGQLGYLRMRKLHPFQMSFWILTQGAGQVRYWCFFRMYGIRIPILNIGVRYLTAYP